MRGQAEQLVTRHPSLATGAKHLYLHIPFCLQICPYCSFYKDLAGAGKADPLVDAVIREADRDGVPAVAKRHKVSEQTLYTWRKRFGAFQPDDVRRLKQLEQENGRLKKLVAERDLEIEVMKEIAAKKWCACRPAGSK